MIVASTVFVILGTGFVMLWGMLTKGVYRTKNQMMPNSNAAGKTKKQLELLKFNKGRVGMTFALSLALGTIVVNLIMVPDWPYRQAARARAAQQQQQAPQQKPARKESPKPDATTPKKDQAPAKETSPAARPDNTSAKPKTPEKS